MMTGRSVSSLIFALTTLTLSAPAWPAEVPEPGFRLVVHADNPAVELDREKVAAFFLLAGQRWDDGIDVEPVTQMAEKPVGEAFARAVHRKSAAAVHGVWEQAAVIGRGPVPVVADDQAVLDWVRGHRGAIGYISPTARPIAGVKVLPLSDREDEDEEGDEDEETEPRRVSLVVDASGSMKMHLDREPKIDIARRTLRDLLTEWDPEIELGLTAFGHRSGACDDIETLIPVGPRQPAQVKAALSRLVARGSTPLSRAIRHAVAELREDDKEETRIVLVSDGVDTCDADPCSLISELAEQGAQITAYVVGFDILRNPNAQAQLRCLAQQSGGTFELAWDAKSLYKALGAALARATGQLPEETLPLVAELDEEAEGEALDLDLRWQLVEAGSVILENPENDGSADGRREVKLENDFWITDSEITQGDWQRLMGNNPSLFSGCSTCPVERVSWFDALAFANRLSQAKGFESCYWLAECSGHAGSGCAPDEATCDGDFTCARVHDLGPRCRGFRLPSNVEWEYIAQADVNARWQNEVLTAADANCAFDRLRGPTEVRTFAASSLGLYDLAGNVREWLTDGPELSRKESLRRQQMIFSGRMDELPSPAAGIRGGSYADPPEDCRAHQRTASLRESRYHAVGFRLVQTAQ